MVVVEVDVVEVVDEGLELEVGIPGLLEVVVLSSVPDAPLASVVATLLIVVVVVIGGAVIGVIGTAATCST